MTAKFAVEHRIFFKSVITHSRKAMTGFLSGHFRYTTDNSEYRSYCTNCGQKNSRSAAENGPRYGVCSEDSEDWALADLRDRTELAFA